MKRTGFAIGLLCACLAAPIQTAAAPTGASFQSLLETDRVAGTPGIGVVVGVIDHGDTHIYKAGSTGGSAALDEHTVFEIGSVTKTFTATILATMVLDHSVALNDPVARYLPSSVHVPSRDGKQITLLNLATQHSGLPRLPTNMDPQAKDPYANYSVQKMYAFLNSYKLTRDPGAQFEYSNFGVALLGIALANRAHLTYGQLLRTRVLLPVGMAETAVSSDMTNTMLAHMAVAHDVDGQPINAWNFQAIAPAGGIRSTLGDMLKYLRCNLGQGRLAKACLFAQQPRATMPGNRIGLVWWTNNSTKIINHGGDTAGFHAWVAISPDHAKGSVALANGGENVSDVAFHAIDPAYPLLPPQKIAQLDQVALDEYVGSYNVAGQPLTFTIARADAGLTVQLTGQPAVRIYPSAKDHFFLKVVQANIDFTRDANGKINALVLHQNGQTLTATKAGASPAPSASPQPSASPIVLDAATLDSYVGTYLLAPGTVFTVKRDGDKLMVQLTGQPFAQVFPSAKDHFYYTVVDAQIDFERDATGKVKDLVLHQNGRDLTAPKQ